MDLTQLASLVGSCLGGGVLLKVFQVWLAHRRAVDGDFTDRHAAARDNFQLVVDHLEQRLKLVEQSDEECRKRNAELEIKVRDLEERIEYLIAKSK